MNKVLELLIDDYLPRKISAECMLLLTKVCDTERKLMDTLSDEQKKEYLRIEIAKAELDIQERNEFAKYLFEAIRSNL